MAEGREFGTMTMGQRCSGCPSWTVATAGGYVLSAVVICTSIHHLFILTYHYVLTETEVLVDFKVDI